MTHCYLTYTGPAPRSIGGVGVFAKDLPPLEVTESIANQYDTDEMHALGWVVTRKKEESPKPVLSPSTSLRASPELVEGINSVEGSKVQSPKSEKIKN